MFTLEEQLKKLSGNLEDIEKPGITSVINKSKEILTEIACFTNVILKGVPPEINIWKPLLRLGNKVNSLIDNYYAILSSEFILNESVNQFYVSSARKFISEINILTQNNWEYEFIISNNNENEILPVININALLIEDFWVLPLLLSQYVDFLNITQLIYSLNIFLDPADEYAKCLSKITKIIFSDMISTQIAGPSYGIASLIYGFRQTKVETNPAESLPIEKVLFLRIHAIRKVLNMNFNLYDSEIKIIDDIWNEKFNNNFNKNLTINKEDSDLFDQLFAILITKDYLLSYDHVMGKKNATEIRNCLENSCDISNLPQNKYSLIDIVNSAWFARIDLDQSYGFNTINKFYHGLLLDNAL